MGRIMGLDVGSRTVGVAVSDLLGWTAQGVEIIRINEDEKEFGIDRMKELVAQFEPTGFVLGLPKNMNNTSGPRVEAAQAYGELLTETFGLPIDFQDERLTTVGSCLDSPKLFGSQRPTCKVRGKLRWTKSKTLSR